MDTHLCIPIYGYPFTNTHLWTPIYDHQRMEISLYISIYGYQFFTYIDGCQFMDVNLPIPIWISTYEYPYILWISMDLYGFQ